MSFSPSDPSGMYTPQYTKYGYFSSEVEYIYQKLRSELHYELRHELAYKQAAQPTPTVSTIPGHKIEKEHIDSFLAAEPRKLTMKIPDSVNVITAYRAWHVCNTKEGLRLKALGQNDVWEPKKAIEAKCTSGKNHRSPDFDCECGIWSFTCVDKLLEALSGYTPSVIGKVSLWGRVVECENGFRAQYAYPAELWLDPKHEDLSWIYGVPVRTAEIKPVEKEKEPQKEIQKRKQVQATCTHTWTKAPSVADPTGELEICVHCNLVSQQASVRKEEDPQMVEAKYITAFKPGSVFTYDKSFYV